MKTQGIFSNQESIVINDNCSVTITIGACTLTIQKRRFRQFVEWYMDDEEKEAERLFSAAGKAEKKCGDVIRIEDDPGRVARAIWRICPTCYAKQRKGE